jgi:hypothetical protein
VLLLLFQFSLSSCIFLSRLAFSLLFCPLFLQLALLPLLSPRLLFPFLFLFLLLSLPSFSLCQFVSLFPQSFLPLGFSPSALFLQSFPLSFSFSPLFLLLLTLLLELSFLLRFGSGFLRCLLSVPPSFLLVLG